jgi:hypothetical protein
MDGHPEQDKSRAYKIAENKRKLPSLTHRIRDVLKEGSGILKHQHKGTVHYRWPLREALKAPRYAAMDEQKLAHAWLIARRPIKVG